MIRLVPLMLFAWTLSACESSNASDTDRLSALDKRVEAVELAERTRSIIDDLSSMAYLTPSENSYSLTKGDFGNVAVVLENVQDYSNGVKVSLRFGNTTTASIQGIRADLEWGRVEGKGAPTGDVKSKSEDFTDDLPAASWHSYEVVLPYVPSKEFDYLRVKNIKSKSISLMNR